MFRLQLFTGNEWMESALCAQTDPELFFADKGDWNKVIRAKLVCRQCQVREKCLAWALENNERFGVWGGMTPTQRQALRSPSRRYFGGMAS